MGDSTRPTIGNLPSWFRLAQDGCATAGARRGRLAVPGSVPAAIPCNPPDHTIYGNHMNETQKTTIYLDSADYQRLKAMARRQGRKPAELVREAVAAYARRGTRVPRSLGAGRSGKGNLSERAEVLLKGMGRAR